jgi:hypothetical protein
MIIVELFATYPEPYWRNVSRVGDIWISSITTLVVLVSKKMSGPINDSCRPERNPNSLYSPDDKPRQSEEKYIDYTKKYPHPKKIMRSIEVPFDPVIWGIVTMFLDCLRVV